MSWLGKVLGLAGGPSTELPEDPEIRSLVHAYMRERGEDPYRVEVKELPSGKALLALPAERLARVIHSTLLEDAANRHDRMDSNTWAIEGRREKLVSEICRRTLPITAEEACAILDLHARLQARDRWFKYKGLPKAIGRAAQAAGHLPAIRASLEKVRDVVRASVYSGYADARKIIKDVELLLDEAAGVTPQGAKIESDAWGDKAHAALEAMDLEARNRWQTVLNYCATAKGSSPTSRSRRALRSPASSRARAKARRRVAWSFCGAKRATQRNTTSSGENPRLSRSAARPALRCGAQNGAGSRP